MEVTKKDDLRDVVLVDDIITRGATLLGAANKIADVYPGVPIRGFAFIRTMSNNFRGIYDPSVGKITLLQDGNTQRDP